MRGVRNQEAFLHTPSSPSQWIVEAVNKTIKHTLKQKLDASEGAWDDKLLQVLWANRTTSRTLIGETPFLMAYVIEAISHVEVGLPLYFDCNSMMYQMMS